MDDGMVKLTAEQIAKAVKQVGDERDALRWLCGNIIATLMLPQNQKHLTPMLARLATRWREQFVKTTDERHLETTPPYALEEDAPG